MPRSKKTRTRAGRGSAQAGEPPAVRDRIKELRRVPASSLIPSAKNWRTHPQSQQDALQGVLSEIGYADALIARERDDGELVLIDGHLRKDTTPDAIVPVLVLDVTEEEADKLLATLDPLASMATADKQKLDALLRDVQTGNEAVGKMLTELAEKANVIALRVPTESANDPNEEWQGMPEFEQEDQLGKYRIIVHFENEDDLKDFGKHLGQSITESTRSIWHPYKEPINGKEFIVEDRSNES